MADDLSATVDAGEVVMLYPGAAPGGDAATGPEAPFHRSGGNGPLSHMIRNVSAPSLTVFLPDPAKANGTGVIIAPGGGYKILAWEHEGLMLARWLADRGYAAFVLKYRLVGTPASDAEFESAAAAQGNSRGFAGMPAVKAPRSLGKLLGDPVTLRVRDLAADDGRAAVAMVRARAAEWGVEPDRVGMIGFSAGAFLAADVTMDPKAPPMAFVAPIYGGETREAAVPADAPPLFTVIAQDDRMLFKVVEGLYADWSNADRPAELHIFAKGGHGFGMVKQKLPVDRWIDLFGDWLADLGLS